jgi:hypothetical protein
MIAYQKNGMEKPNVSYLSGERECLERLLPGLDAELESYGIDRLGIPKA